MGDFTSWIIPFPRKTRKSVTGKVTKGGGLFFLKRCCWSKHWTPASWDQAQMQKDHKFWCSSSGRERQMWKSSLSSSCNKRLLCRKAMTRTPTSVVVNLARWLKQNCPSLILIFKQSNKHFNTVPQMGKQVFFTRLLQNYVLFIVSHVTWHILSQSILTDTLLQLSKTKWPTKFWISLSLKGSTE